MVKKFKYTHGVKNALKQSLSEERLGTYLTGTKGHLEKAISLYTWNTAVSSAFYGPLQGLEIALRNALHRELTDEFGKKWYESSKCKLNHPGYIKIDNAKKQLKRCHKPIEPNRVIAELSFGFWVTLLGPGGRKYNYEMNLWRPALYKAFSSVKVSRKQVHSRLEYLRIFRNRIAHHEPIFDRHLEADYNSIIEVTEWICEDTARWIGHHSRVKNLLKSKEINHF